MKIKLDELAAALSKSDVLQGYVDLEQGKVLLLGEDFSASSSEPGVSDAQQLEHVFSLEDQWQRYVALPNAYDADDRDVMRGFAAALENEAQKQELLELLQQAGAAARFVRQLRRMKLADAWQAYLMDHFRAAARDWCEENDVPYEE